MLRFSAEHGDFDQDEYKKENYTTVCKFIPTQNSTFEKDVLDSHKKHR